MTYNEAIKYLSDKYGKLDHTIKDKLNNIEDKKIWILINQYSFGIEAKKDLWKLKLQKDQK